jgi:long-chain acyl-CoA synthetase
MLKRFAKSEHTTSANGAGSEELNLDSLGRVELQASLEEQFGRAVDDSEIQQVRTVSELKNLFDQNRQAEKAVSRRDEIEKDRHIYPVWPLRSLVKGLRIAFIELVMRPFVYVLANPMVRRTTRFSPSGPLLIYANHVTAVDPAMILFALPSKLRRSVAIAMSGEILFAWRNRTYYKYRFLNWISPFEYLVVTALFNVFPLPQQSGFRRSFRHAGRAMDRGYSVMVFPEGRRSTDEVIQPFMSGSGLLWSELGCPALPIYLSGLGELKRTGERWFRSRKLEVVIGEPIPFDPEVSAEDGAQILERELKHLEAIAAEGKLAGNFYPTRDV